MKFAIVVVMLALALGAQGSAIPWAGHGWDAYDDGSYHGDHGAWDDGSYHGEHEAYGHYGHVATHGIELSQGPSYGHYGHAAVAVHHSPAIAVHHGHGHGHDAHYVAKTLGAVHTAPLAGHTANVESYNVASAPGTH